MSSCPLQRSLGRIKYGTHYLNRHWRVCIIVHSASCNWPLHLSCVTCGCWSVRIKISVRWAKVLTTTFLAHMGYWLGGRPSAAVPRESARKRADSARFRADPANFRQKYFPRTPPNVRRTFGGLRRTPRGNGRIRAESAANWRKSSLEKCSPTKTYLTPPFLAEDLPYRTTLRRGRFRRGLFHRGLFHRESNSSLLFCLGVLKWINFDLLTLMCR